MLTTVKGIYRDGKVELAEIPMNLDEETPVIVTFLIGRYVDLESRDISKRQTLELRERLAGFAEDWDSSEMDVYDRYDGIRSAPC